MIDRNDKEKLKRDMPLSKKRYRKGSILDLILRLTSGFAIGILFEFIGWDGFLGFFIGQLIFIIILVLLFNDRIYYRR